MFVTAHRDALYRRLELKKEDKLSISFLPLPEIKIGDYTYQMINFVRASNIDLYEVLQNIKYDQGIDTAFKKLNNLSVDEDRELIDLADIFTVGVKDVDMPTMIAPPLRVARFPLNPQ